MPISAATAAIAGVPQAVGHLDAHHRRRGGARGTVARAAVRVGDGRAAAATPTAFGTFMALEPAIGETLGLVVLHQTPSALQVTGIALVVVAGAAAQREDRPGSTLAEQPGIAWCSYLSSDRCLGISMVGRHYRAGLPALFGSAGRRWRQSR